MNILFFADENDQCNVIILKEGKYQEAVLSETKNILPAFSKYVRISTRQSLHEEGDCAKNYKERCRGHK